MGYLYCVCDNNGVWYILQDMMEDVYEVNINGEPDEDLLDIIKVKDKCMYLMDRQTML